MSKGAHSKPVEHRGSDSFIPPETWFFRYPESFEHLRRHAKARRAPHSLRIVSLGCASGAEAFSIAAALEGVVPAQIVAVDTNAAELDIGRSGRLRPMTVRSEAPAWAHAPWHIDAGAVVVRPALREQVSFLEHDALDPTLAQTLGTFDVVFCRNLLIYLDEAKRAQLGVTIASLLRPCGWLYMGHADRPSALALSWRGRSSAAFAFRSPRRASAQATAEEHAIDCDHEVRDEADAKPPIVRKTTVTPRTRAKAAPSSQRSVAAPHSLESIRMLADAGHTVEAHRAAAGLHDTGIRSAELLEVLGTLCVMTGKLDDAERHLRAALYVDPTRDDAALQLRLLQAKRRGEVSSEALPSSERDHG